MESVVPNLLKVTTSSILNSGDGVFATQDIDAGVVIAEYRGEFVDNNMMLKRPVEQVEISLNVGGGLSIVGETTTDIPGEIAGSKFNDSVILRNYTNEELDAILEAKSLPRRHEHNCEFKIVGDAEFSRVFVVTTKNINTHDELFIDYGFQYWIGKLIRDELVDVPYATEKLATIRRALM